MAESKRVTRNYLAIAAAAVACFLFEMLWYSLFLDVWLKGIGRDRSWLEHTGANPALQFSAALLAEALIALSISCIVQLTGPQTALRGIKAAAALWMGLVLPPIAVGGVFAELSYASFAVDCGFWLIGMMLMGAIVGAWKSKTGKGE
jgi:hypothetical protein